MKMFPRPGVFEGDHEIIGEYWSTKYVRKTVPGFKPGSETHKPRIFRAGGDWRCDDARICALSHTPARAWAAWREGIAVHTTGGGRYPMGMLYGPTITKRRKLKPTPLGTARVVVSRWDFSWLKFWR